MFELDHSIGYLLNRVAGQMRVDLDQELAPFGVTAPQWAVMMRCFHRDDMTPIGLARTIGVDGAAITRLLDRMEAKGLLARRSHTTDRRSLVIELTSRGRTLAPQLPPLAKRVLERALAGFSAAERKELELLLQRMLANGESASQRDRTRSKETARTSVRKTTRRGSRP